MNYMFKNILDNIGYRWLYLNDLFFYRYAEMNTKESIQNVQKDGGR